MMDFSRMGLPKVVELDGVKWLCLYYVAAHDDGGEFYIACRGDDVLPAACHLIKVPK